jgi:hypothetical protein
MAEPGASGGEAEGFVEIARVWSMPEASVLLATLSAYGFAAVPINQSTLSVVPDLTVALGGIGILVHSGEVEEALALLEEIDEGWACPPPPLADDPVLSGAASVGMAWFGAPPMPRISGDYAWRPKRSREP